MKYTPETYKRIGKDKAYTDKAIDAMARMDFGENVKVEFTDNGKVIINDAQVLNYGTYAQKAIDRQSALSERPELEGVYKSRQKRQETAEKFSNPNLQEKSKDEMMAEGAMKSMLSNASKRGLASQKQHTTKTNLPSEQ
ncbi:hypothetical protein N9X61_01230 [Sulfurimonas sp.]|nr:hypothetical protein [Sulfurimonas sp.]